MRSSTRLTTRSLTVKLPVIQDWIPTSPSSSSPLKIGGEKKYSAELTITQEVAEKNEVGVIYYFCHIHSKMSGNVVIKNEDGTAYTNGKADLPLYVPTVNDAFDTKCGTCHTSEYADGAKNECKTEFFAGMKDTEFEKCLHAVDY